MRFISFLLILTSLHSYSQEPFFQNAELGFQGHYGSFFTSSSKADFVKDSYTSFGTFSFSKPVRNFPVPRKVYPLQWGAALFYGNTGSKQYLGKMGGGYGFLDFGIWGTSLTSIRVRTGLGLGIVEFPYNAETNHKNLLIGSKVNLFIHAAIKNVWHLNSLFDVNAGVSLSHLSNATTKLPNLGLNVPAFTAGVSVFVNRKTIITKPRSDSNTKRREIHFQLTSGMKQSPWVNSPSYSQFILASEFLYRHSPYGKYGGGLTVNYDPSQDELYIDDIITIGMKNYSTINLTAFGSYEVILGRLSVPIQLGVSILETKKRVYQNYGIKYQLNKKFSLAGFLRTHGGSADFVHGGLSYKIK